MWIFRAPPGERYPKTDPHAHHVIQVTFALTGQIAIDGERGRVEGDGESGWESGGAIAIAPSALHAFEGTGLIAHLFIASDGKAGRQIARGLFSKGPLASVPARQLGDFPARLRATFEDPRHTDDDLRALGRSMIARLASEGARPEAPDPRIAGLLAWVAPRLAEPLRLDEAAAFIGLSPGRARHLFVQQTGLPFRTYLLWLRLMHAVELYAGRASLTEAAHGAGFADSAHLSRTFRRMFGIAAASLRMSAVKDLRRPLRSSPRSRSKPW